MVHYIHLFPSEFNVCAANREQDVLCDASGGTFTLIFDGAETDSISFDADETVIASLLEELSSISDVDVSFPAGVTQACQQSPADGSNGFRVTFLDVVNYRGDVPEMTSNIDNLEVLYCISYVVAQRHTPKHQASHFSIVKYSASTTT